MSITINTTKLQYRDANNQFQNLSLVGDISKEALLNEFQSRINAITEDLPQDLPKKVEGLKNNSFETKIKNGRIIYIDDAFEGLAPLEISAGAQIFGKNFGLLNGKSYTQYGVTFTLDSDDPNTISISGKATNNVYTDGSITASTARIRVPAGTYYIRTFSEDLGTQNINFYINNVTAGNTYVAPANTPTALTFNQETVLGIRFQIPNGSTVNTTLSLYFGMVETDTYEPYYYVSNTLNQHSTVIFENTSGVIKYVGSSIQYLNNISESNKTEIFDAINGVDALNIPASAIVYSRNMYRASLGNRVSNGITFKQDNYDLNTIYVSGTASADAYSFAGITAGNSILLDAGIYYIAYYSENYTDTTDKQCWLRLDILPTAGGTQSARDLRDHCYKLVLNAQSYVSVRLLVKSGTTLEDCVHVYFSKYLPLPEYIKYDIPNKIMKRYSIVEGLASGETLKYYRQAEDNTPVNIKVATFNVGDYSSGASIDTTTDGIPTNMNNYIKYISSLNADLLCTQEDRLVYNTTTNEKIYDIFYKYLYKASETESYSISIDTHTGLKRISSNYSLSPSGRYTFINQGSDPNTGAQFWSSFTYSGIFIKNHYILLIDVHLAPKQGNTSIREEQITELLDFVDACNVENVIICGDFNTWDTELNALINKGYVIANHGLYGSIPTFYIDNHAFDNICIKSNNIKMRAVKAEPNDLNDHYALTATLTII